MDGRVKPYGIHTSLASLPGLTRQSIAFQKTLPKMMDTRVKPAYDEMCESRRVKPGHDASEFLTVPALRSGMKNAAPRPGNTLSATSRFAVLRPAFPAVHIRHCAQH
jgi:hypothetical protein